MKQLTGIEALHSIYEIPDFLEIFISFTQPLYIHDTLYIYEQGKNAEEAEDFLKEACLLQEIHPLIKIEKGIEGTDFFDYGFCEGSSIFLFKNSLAAFKVTGKNKLQKEMALLQLEEHLIYTSIGGNDERIFFSNSNYMDLIKGIVKAYEVEVEFLDLDK